MPGQTQIEGEPQLIQLRYRENPWKMMVACILLNRTQRKQVDRVIEELFQRWPSSAAMMNSGPELSQLLHSLGMSDRRAYALRAFSRDWREYRVGRMPLDACYGVGSYAHDSYRLFVMGDLSVSPTDKELKRWLHYRLEGAACT